MIWQKVFIATVSLLQVQVQEVEDEGGDDEEEIIVPKHAQAGEGQLGIGGTEKAGGVDSSGVSEHIHDHPTVLSAGTTANGTKLDATGAQMPKQARAAGVDRCFSFPTC